MPRFGFGSRKRSVKTTGRFHQAAWLGSSGAILHRELRMDPWWKPTLEREMHARESILLYPYRPAGDNGRPNET